MLKASDLMKAHVPSVQFDITVTDAIEYFKTHNTDFAVVRASGDRLNGVLTEAILMRIYLRYQNQPQKESMILYREHFEPIQLVQESEEFPVVVKKIMTSVGHRVFVINKQSEVVGLITTKDILPYFNENFKLAREGKKVSQQAQISDLNSDLYLFETFFTKSPFLMHSVNHQGVIQMANEVLHFALGYPYGELIGKTIFDLYPKENHDKAREGLKNILQKGYHKVTKATMLKKDNTILEVEMMSRALLNQNDAPIGTITISRPTDMAYLIECLPHH